MIRSGIHLEVITLVLFYEDPGESKKRIYIRDHEIKRRVKPYEYLLPQKNKPFYRTAH